MVKFITVMRSLIVPVLGFTLVACDSAQDQPDNDTVYAARLFEELSGDEPMLSIEKLKGGASLSGLYKVQGQTQAYVLRVLDINRDKNSILREIETSQALGELGVSPKIYATSKEKAALLMEEIEGAALFKSRLSREEIIDLAGKIRLVHEQRPKSMQQHWTARDFVVEVINVHLTFDLPVEYKTTFKRLEPQFLTLEQNPKFTLAHTDLNPGNMLLSKDGIKLIDWETANIYHPYIDLATVFIFYNFSEFEKDLFLSTYVSGNNKVKRQELNAAYKIMNYVYALNLLGISYRLAHGGKAAKIVEKESLREMIKSRRWGEITPRLGDKDIAYTVSQILLEESTL